MVQTSIFDFTSSSPNRDSDGSSSLAAVSESTKDSCHNEFIRGDKVQLLEMNSLMFKQSFQALNTIGDENCLFYGVNSFVRGVSARQCFEEIKYLRETVADYYLQHRMDFEHFDDWQHSGGSFDEHVRKIRCTHEYACETEIRVLELVLRRPIIVYNNSGAIIRRHSLDIEFHLPLQPIYLLFQPSTNFQDSGHYSALALIRSTVHPITQL
jgi:hypothetical protein